MVHHGAGLGAVRAILSLLVAAACIGVGHWTYTIERRVNRLERDVHDLTELLEMEDKVQRSMLEHEEDLRQDVWQLYAERHPEACASDSKAPRDL